MSIRENAPGAKVSRDAVYLYLWTNARGRQNTISKPMKEIADELGLTDRTMTNIVGEFVNDGRVMRKYGKYFLMVDPELEKWSVDEDALGVVDVIQMHTGCSEQAAKGLVTALHDAGWGVVKL